MSGWATQREVECIRARYPAGTRVELIQMDDVQAPPAGTHGTIAAADDVGDLIVEWDNGSGLKLIPGVDEFRVLHDEPKPGGDV